MNKLIFGLLCLIAGMQANDLSAIAEQVPNKKIKEKVSYDTDLFHKDQKVLFVNGEFLYWIINEGALDYALQMKNPAWGSSTEGVGHYKKTEFDWSPGFRVNFGYFNAPHYWDAFVQYTYFRGTGSSRARPHNSPSKFLNGTWPQPGFFAFSAAPLAKAHSSIEMNLNLLEALCSRRFHPNPHLRVRLYGGATIAWIKQDWRVNYRDTESQKSRLKNVWKFTGAGVRAGYLVDWFLGKGGFFLTALISGAIYAGDYHNVSKQKSTDSQGGTFDPLLPLRNVHYHDTRLVPHLQASMGPSWQQGFGKYRTEFFIGYELNLWANLHEVFRTSIGAPTAAKQTFINNSVMGIQGLIIRWNLDF